MNPTKRAEWVKPGDRATIDGRMVGTVLRVVPVRSLPYAVVQWPTSIGRHSITLLRRVIPGHANWCPEFHATPEAPAECRCDARRAASNGLAARDASSRQGAHRQRRRCSR